MPRTARSSERRAPFARTWASRLTGLAALVVTGCPRPTTTAAPPAARSEGAAGDQQPIALVYPQAERLDLVETHHGQAVPDPYRWLEDPDAPPTRTWIEAENAVTFGYLDAIEARDPLRKRLTALWDYERWDTPERHGPNYVLRRNDGLQNQAVLMVTPSLADPPRVLLDPNTLSADGTVALAQTEFSHDGSLMVYGISEAGSDWQTWRVRDVATATDTSDELRWIKFSNASWTLDGKGFYYARYDEPKPGVELEALNYDQKVFYHRIGEPQSADTLVYARPDHREWGFDAEVTEDGRYLVVTVRVGTDPKTSVFYQDLRARRPKMVEMLPEFTARYEFVGSEGPVLWFLTDADAPRRRLVAIDVRRPGRSNWRELVPQSDDTLRGVAVVGERFFANYLHDAHSQVSMFALDGKPLGALNLPGLGTVRGLTGRRDHNETFYAFTSFAQPATVYRYAIDAGETEVVRAPEVAFDPANYVTDQVFFRSVDGTQIPLFLTRRKDVALKGDNPVMLYGYGGFNIPITPRFSVPNLVFMELGGIYAVANLRGGGEYGEAWHLAGTRLQKQNVFDDFIGAAQYLIAEGITKPSRLAISGRSNGGLLVGAAMTQRPDLFGVALPGVGVMDMLRFNKFTIGWAWQSDYGSPENPEEFAALFAYSPYHNLREGTAYPATLVYTADHDDRVVPAHSFKYAAALQHAQAGANPVLIRIDVKAGHGAGKPTAKLIDEATDLLGFTVENLGMDVSSLPN